MVLIVVQQGATTALNTVILVEFLRQTNASLEPNEHEIKHNGFT